MKTEHTPGPWNFSHGRISSRAHQTSKDLRLTVIADLDMENDSHGEQEANARLIAAAPELLEAMQHALDVMEIFKVGEGCGTQKAAREAIAKATQA